MRRGGVTLLRAFLISIQLSQECAGISFLRSEAAADGNLSLKLPRDVCQRGIYSRGELLFAWRSAGC
jgi:hypothetical protein